jgi:endonuclease-3
MARFSLARVMEGVATACRDWVTPSVSVIAEQHRSPYHVLVSCIISLRTKDAVTAVASRRLFEQAPDLRSLASLDEELVASCIYPAGFYRNKARQLCALARELSERSDARIPDTMEGLLALPGVGRKTANLVLTLGFGLPGICVDIHVHRICNRWGYVETRTPDETKAVLRTRLPKQYWIPINDLLVCFGQNCCYPVSPACSRCAVSRYCPRVGVTRSR